MDPERSVPPGQETPDEAALAAPFHVFVLVCDREKAIAPRAAVRFQRLLEDGRVPAVYARMLEFCRANYDALWRSYASGALAIDLDGFSDLLDDLHRALPPSSYLETERRLRGLADSLLRASHRFRAGGSRLRVREDLERAFAEPRRPRGSARRRPIPPATLDPKGAPGGAVPAVTVETSPPRLESPPTAAPRRPPSPGPSAPPPMPPSDRAWVKGPVRLVCTRIVDEARHVKTFSFHGLTRTWFHHQPGQFVTIAPVIDGKTVPRSYTISSSPTRPALLEITVKRVPGGLVSNWLHDRLGVGDELDARGPSGRFSCLRHPAAKYLFLAAGSGITPLMSMLRYLADTAAPVDVVFFQSASTEGDIIFRKELALIDERSPGIRTATTLTDPPADGGWSGLTGRLDNDMLLHVAPDLADRMVFACGPPPFLDKAKQLLAGNGFPLDARFAEESFVPASPKGRGRPSVPATAAASRLRFVKSGRTVDATAGETILETAERCGVPLASSCRQGRCGTCRVTVANGEVSMPDQEALDPDDLARGDVLACVAVPRGDAVDVDL